MGAGVTLGYLQEGAGCRRHNEVTLSTSVSLWDGVCRSDPKPHFLMCEKLEWFNEHYLQNFHEDWR